MLTVLLIGSVSLYVLLGLGAAVLVRRRHVAAPVPDEALPPVSILVAARNEADNLPRCLEALRRQRYPADRIEFVIADDHSTDDTPDIVRRMQQRDERFRLVTVPTSDNDALRGKPHTLHTALQRTRAELLLATDADCAPPPDWARNMAAQFQDERVGMVCGVTAVEHDDALSRLQALDWLLLLTVASAASGLGLPITAMGNNMAFRRAAYEDVGGYPALPFSVTEDYELFKALHNHPNWSVRLLLDRSLRNVTRPLDTLRDVFRQRRRWARGGLRAPSWVYALYVLVFLVHLLLLVGAVIVPALALPLLLGKIGLDAGLLYVGGKRLAAAPPLRTLPLFEGYLFGYVLLMPLALLVAPRIQWKGRRH